VNEEGWSVVSRWDKLIAGCIDCAIAVNARCIHIIVINTLLQEGSGLVINTQSGCWLTKNFGVAAVEFTTANYVRY